MKIRTFFAALFAVCAVAASAQQALPSLPLDTAVRVGKLGNGLTYFLRHNNWPENRADFYIAQKVGSLQEEESQRGLAHFLEHMCFNGTENFPGDALVRYCEQIGVAFGVDLNAYTSIEETVYNINNVPTARRSALDSCLLILHDWADGLTLDPEEIDKERGVIHEEWRLRTGASSRMIERNLPKLYPGSKYGLRFPIGLMSVVDNFKYKELRDYYEKWYHPTNQGIIIVGDIDLDYTEAKVKELFGPMENPENAAPIVEETVPDNALPIVVVDKDKEQTRSVVSFMVKHDPLPKELKNTQAQIVQGYLCNAAMGMLSQRLDEVKQQPDCPFTQASAAYGPYIYARTKDALDLSVVPKTLGQAEEALKAVLVEARRAAEFGFTATEYIRMQESITSAIEKEYSNRDKRTNGSLAQKCIRHFLDNDPMMDIEDTYNMMKALIPNIPLEAVNGIMAQMLPKNDSNIVVLSFNNEAEGNVYPTEAGFMKALYEARAEKIEPYVDNVKNEPLMTELPQPGVIVNETENDKFGYTELELSNGVKVLLKHTDYKKDQVLLQGEGLGGASLYGPEDYVNIGVFNSVVGYSGLGNFSSMELKKALAGKIANADLTLTDENTRVDGSSTPKDVETMFQMAHLYFTAIKKDQQSVDAMVGMMRTALKDRHLSPETAAGDSLTATLYGHNPRLKPLAVEDLPLIDYDRILQMAKERTATAAGWTFTIIGNYDQDSIRGHICRYLGSLPTAAAPAKGHRVKDFVDGRVDNFFARKMETPKASAVVVWHNDSIPYTVENAIRMDIAGQILDMEFIKKIREDAGAAYSCSAYGGASNTNGHNLYNLVASCPVKPEMRDTALAIMYAEPEALSKACDPSKLAKVKEYMLKSFDTQVKTNGYWAGVMNYWRKYGIDTHTGYRKAVEEQTPEAISAFMRGFLSQGNRVTVVMHPAE